MIPAAGNQPFNLQALPPTISIAIGARLETYGPISHYRNDIPVFDATSSGPTVIRGVPNPVANNTDGHFQSWIGAVNASSLAVFLPVYGSSGPYPLTDDLVAASGIILPGKASAGAAIPDTIGSAVVKVPYRRFADGAGGYAIVGSGVLANSYTDKNGATNYGFDVEPSNGGWAALITDNIADVDATCMLPIGSSASKTSYTWVANGVDGYDIVSTITLA